MMEALNNIYLRIFLPLMGGGMIINGGGRRSEQILLSAGLVFRMVLNFNIIILGDNKNVKFVRGVGGWVMCLWRT